MIIHNQEYSTRHLRRIKKIIINQLQIHKKAEQVMSNTPPNSRYASCIKANYIKTSRLTSLPPILAPQQRLKSRYYPESITPAPKIPRIPKGSSKITDLGIVNGFSKYFSVRRRSKSQDTRKPLQVSEKTQVDPLDITKDTIVEDHEVCPLTILVKFKKHIN
ncbi:hypothetical protein SteCoe_36345 [Stentor coeruleus]|uniref:Uncharacterized protein n=1 Tax=Stentor coeruleus TaxID=5963 RepID=A0A1R2AQB7_9CILI|nr:hypothetical protein SteCoe_36345 [Stentor coeruleus]